MVVPVTREAAIRATVAVVVIPNLMTAMDQAIKRMKIALRQSRRAIGFYKKLNKLNACKRIRKRRTGQMNLIITIKSFSRRNALPF